MSEANKKLLSVRNLRTIFRTENGLVPALDSISFDLDRGQTLAIVGESGCGKSVTAMSIMGLIQEANGVIESGSILFDGVDLVSLSKDRMRALRGNRLSMIFQEPMTALNPVYTIGQQIAEVYQIHRGYTRTRALEEAAKMLHRVRFPDAEKRLKDYPFQLSGGMRQRVMIAMALACEPSLLIADEPTTALDVTIQAQILGLMKELQRERETSIIFITHDLGVVAEVADHVVVIYAGRAIEQGDVKTIFRNAQHPYTRGLLHSIPSRTTTKKDKLYTIEGSVPQLRDLPQGCHFQGRCPQVHDRCRQETPAMQERQAGHQVACFWRENP